jgi:catechol 2,3-dioxygenase-like lactoylglutathione lyase family enzyme
MEQRISFFTLGVSDLARSEAFYRRLGWTPSDYGVEGKIVFFQLNGLVMALFGRADLAQDAGLPESPPAPFSGITVSHNTRTEAEVETVIAQAAAAGATVLKPPHRADWGGIVAYFSDPDGHAWEVCYNPHAKIADDGSVWLPR